MVEVTAVQMLGNIYQIQAFEWCTSCLLGQ